MNEHSASRRPIVATYRLQLTPDFGFADVVSLLEPLVSLGVSHLYLSPIAEAHHGSSHGYDVTDHTTVRSEFGGAEGLDALLDAADAADLGVVIDHVPNHVSIADAASNHQWWSVLRDGRGSEFADWFDIDWGSTGGRVIVPKLGRPVDAVLDDGELVVDTGDDGVARLRYGPLTFPVAEGTESLLMRELLAAQHYELTWWRDPRRNMRRFFTIDDLAAVCVEHDAVAQVVDTLPRRLSGHPAFAGVRVDHVDGLADPAGYLDGLRATIGDRWLLVEKILAPDETLPRLWPVDGTTGYEHIAVSEHALVDPAALAPLSELWSELADDPPSASFADAEHRARAEVLDDGLAPDFDRLTASLDESGNDVEAAADTRAALAALTLALDRYRTYLPDPESVPVFEEVHRRAVAQRPELAESIDRVAAGVRDDHAVRWQQLTGPVMAKGAEDRAFYRHQRLASLCEVGGWPGTWAIAATRFHAHQERVQDGWPATMLAGTTHDTKRSAAVRARSLALAAAADEWAIFTRRWIGRHGPELGPVRLADVSLALQTVVCAQPLDAERLRDYLVKAAREADVSTGWVEPDADYESALATLAARLTDATDDDIATWSARLETAGATIGLRLLALQLTCPGVPDLYQGAPFELTSLVDPDNRRPPDWATWRDVVAAAGGTSVRSRGEKAPDRDRDRAAMTQRLLRLRRRRIDAFGTGGGYRPLRVTGPGADAVIGFARCDGPTGEALVVTVVGRALGAPIRDAVIELPDGTWRSVLDDDARVIASARVPFEQLAGGLGLAVLDRTDR